MSLNIRPQTAAGRLSPLRRMRVSPVCRPWMERKTAVKCSGGEWRRGRGTALLQMVRRGERRSNLVRSASGGKEGGGEKIGHDNPLRPPNFIRRSIALGRRGRPLSSRSAPLSRSYPPQTPAGSGAPVPPNQEPPAGDAAAPLSCAGGPPRGPRRGPHCSATQTP